MAERNAATPEDQQIVFRVGVNLGDIIVEDDDIFGDDLNVAARLEALAAPGVTRRLAAILAADVQKVRFDRMGLTGRANREGPQTTQPTHSLAAT